MLYFGKSQIFSNLTNNSGQNSEDHPYCNVNDIFSYITTTGIYVLGCASFWESLTELHSLKLLWNIRWLFKWQIRHFELFRWTTASPGSLWSNRLEALIWIDRSLRLIASSGIRQWFVHRISFSTNGRSKTPRSVNSAANPNMATLEQWLSAVTNSNAGSLLFCDFKPLSKTKI